MSTIIKQNKKFHSRAYHHRPALIPVTIVILAGWIIDALAFAVAVSSVHYSPFWGSLMLVAVVASAAYLVFMTYRWVTDGQKVHEITIEGDLITLTSFDSFKRTTASQRMLLGDVRSAEYYEPRDVSNLMLRSRNDSMEIPLWSFDPMDQHRIIDRVRGAGIQLIGIRNEIVARYCARASRDMF